MGSNCIACSMLVVFEPTPKARCYHCRHMLYRRAMVWQRPCTLVPAQGALLLVLFQVSHTVEHQLTDRATGSLQTLFDSIPDSATLVELGATGEPDMDQQRQVQAADVQLEQTMLVKPGEQVRRRAPQLPSACHVILQDAQCAQGLRLCSPPHLSCHSSGCCGAVYPGRAGSGSASRGDRHMRGLS